MNIISFDESSEITVVPESFIEICRSLFILPPNVKRLISSGSFNYPKIVSKKIGQRFVSTAESHTIMNHIPLEIAHHHSFKHQFIIRESVRFIGGFSFYLNNNIISVVIPSSVESIGHSSFDRCSLLLLISFKNNSKLKTIGEQSFFMTALESVVIPSSVEEIMGYSFYGCWNLKSVTFYKESNLQIIEEHSFESIALMFVYIPPSVKIIGLCSFHRCTSLRSTFLLSPQKIFVCRKFFPAFLEINDGSVLQY